MGGSPSWPSVSSMSMITTPRLLHSSRHSFLPSGSSRGSSAVMFPLSGVRSSSLRCISLSTLLCTCSMASWTRALPVRPPAPDIQASSFPMARFSSAVSSLMARAYRNSSSLNQLPSRRLYCSSHAAASSTIFATSFSGMPWLASKGRCTSALRTSPDSSLSRSWLWISRRRFSPQDTNMPFLLPTIFSMVEVMTFALTCSWTTRTILPSGPASTLGTPSTTSRYDLGGSRISSSPGYCDTNLTEAPRSIPPTSISKIVGTFCPAYCRATWRSTVVLIIANSQPPRTPNASGLVKASGSSSPPRPRYTLRSSGSFMDLDSLMMPLTMQCIVVVYLLPCISLTMLSGKLRRTALYLQYMGPVYSCRASTSSHSRPAALTSGCAISSFLDLTTLLCGPPDTALPFFSSLTISHSSAEHVSVS
mmetsp:Transcript_37144/g.94886  ORF Transcript_37144/g.94886 Transcript_37144/m.94886 type:complete len:420 (-) Transcript_37144:1121-2380(-)